MLHWSYYESQCLPLKPKSDCNKPSRSFTHVVPCNDQTIAMNDRKIQNLTVQPTESSAFPQKEYNKENYEDEMSTTRETHLTFLASGQRNSIWISYLEIFFFDFLEINENMWASHKRKRKERRREKNGKEKAEATQGLNHNKLLYIDVVCCWYRANTRAIASVTTCYDQEMWSIRKALRAHYLCISIKWHVATYACMRMFMV